MAQDPTTSNPRRFTYAEARALVPEVRRLTEAAHARVAQLQARLGGDGDGPLREQIEHEVAAWAQSMTELGLEVKGLWLVDFDNGAGYYCWSWPETALEFYHSYEEGFSGRVRIH